MIYSIQYLRGLAALLVLAAHVATKGAQYAGDPMPWFTIGGLAGVELFFVISGFIMCYTTADKVGTKGSVKRFLTNRFTRILPLYWTLTFLGLIVFLLFPDRVNTGGGETKVLESFILIPTSGVYIIKNGWTLTYEFFFYFIFSLGMLFPRRLGRLFTLGILLILVLLHFVIPFKNVFFSFATSPLMFDFILGILLFELYERRSRIPGVASLSTALTGLTMLIVLNQSFPSGPPAFVTGIACFLLSAGFVVLEKSIRNNEIRFFTLIGNASYSLYLVHPFALAAAAFFLSRFGLTQGIWAWLFLASIALLALLAGILCYLFFEKPLTNSVRSYTARLLYQSQSPPPKVSVGADNAQLRRVLPS